MIVFKSLKNKLLALMMALSLLPLVGISTFSYFYTRRQIAGDRIRLSLEKMAQDTADKIDIMLRGQKQEVASMATTFQLLYPSLEDDYRSGVIRLLNNYCINHEVYDLLVIVDNQGRIYASNTLDRIGIPLSMPNNGAFFGRNISAYPGEAELYRNSITGLSFHHDWYQSGLVHLLYDYEKDDQDVSHQYNIAFSEPIRNPQSHEIIGVWISIINWYYIQNILDSVESDLASLDMKTGYAFMFAKDADTIIGHKYRKNREGVESLRYPEVGDNLYGTKLIENHGLSNLHDAIERQDRNFAYEFPPGNWKISGIAPINDTSFGWVVGVGIDESDISRPINVMTWWIAGVTMLLGLLVVLSTYLVSRGITVPLNNLIRTAKTIAQGSLAQRVQVTSSDEVGVLGSSFNDMAQALSEREDELQELNRNLESMVRQRTMEVEQSHDALKKAYIDLQNTQEQLVHTEKMASLGQLVAGIAHEIKNPLNFIYGNTGFLADYAVKLQQLLEAYEKLPSLSDVDRSEIQRLKEAVNYSFIQEDLPVLIDNFTEGASRINAIVSDLRTFSRMDADTVSEIDVHASLEMSLNLLRNQYKERIEIHREYGEIPKIHGYSGKLSQVFMNLLSNAFQAIPEKGDVWIRTGLRDGMVQVEIHDSGKGIQKDHLSRIFEPFFTTKSVGQGTGLGLSISYGIIEQHHGRIFAANAPGGGSIFTVHLPISQEKAEE